MAARPLISLSISNKARWQDFRLLVAKDHVQIRGVEAIPYQANASICQSLANTTCFLPVRFMVSIPILIHLYMNA